MNKATRDVFDISHVHDILNNNAVFSRERLTTVICNRGFVTKLQLLKKLFTQNLLTEIGNKLGKQVSQCRTETISKVN